MIYRQPFSGAYHRVETSEKVVALTFDDGPDPIYTSQLLEVLDRHQIKATFFMVGRKIEDHPKLATGVYARGHEVGNHSYSHQRMLLKSFPFIRREIDRTDLLLRGLGVRGDIHFRTPFTAPSLGLPFILWQRRKKNIHFNVNSRDWEVQDPPSVMQRVLGDVRPGSIILLHDGGGERFGTVRAVEMMVPALKQRDFRFVTISQLLTYAGR